MEIVLEPVAEAALLWQASEEATPEEIQDALTLQAECCVDHLCGCSASIPVSELPAQA